MKIKYLINPFEKTAGWQALIIGIVIMSLTAIIGKINHVAFDGALDAHVGATFSFFASFAMQAVDFLVLFLSMWLVGICFSKTKVRAIDVAGTMSLARAPMLLLVVICFLPLIPASLYDIPGALIITIISIILIIWMIALMYNAYSVSCHLKGSRATISFIGALLVAEIVSKLIFFFLLSSLFGNFPVNSASGTGSTGDTAIVNLSEIRQTAKKVVNALEKNDYDGVVVYFDDNMKKKFPVSSLKMAWSQVIMMSGTFEKADFDHVKEGSIDKYDILFIPLVFTNGKLNLQLTFNKDGTIGGLFFKPAS